MGRRESGRVGGKKRRWCWWGDETMASAPGFDVETKL